MENTPNNPGNSGPLPGPLEPGTLLQRRYAIQHLIGGGGMGMVYLAHDQRLSNRPCAIKEMVDHFIDPQQRIEANDYFAREADTLAQLKHPAIPAISDRFDDQNRHYLVMEYVEGRNLEEEIAARGGPLPEGLVIDVARQLCDVLAYLHGLIPPVVYRDMKPSNVMLTEKGRVVLVDFGIARLFKAARKGTMIGTLGFAPPEQYQGIADPRSDIYSLGATLHYIVTGRDPEKFPPFSFPPIRSLRPDLSSNLAGAIDHALAYEMDGRPATIQEFRDMMLYGRGLSADGAAHVSSKSGTAGLSPVVLPPEAVHAPVRRVRRRPINWKRRATAFAIFTVVLAGMAFGATYIYSNQALQAQLGLTDFVNGLPWKHAELLAKARAHPLDFDRMTLTLSTRSGTATSPPKASFTDTELASAQYVKWNATLKNNMAGLDGLKDRVEARFFDPGGKQFTTSSDTQFVGPKQATVDFSGVALIPSTAPIAPGSYKISLYSDNRMLAEQRFTVVPDLKARAAAAKAAAEAAAAAKADELKRKQEATRLAMIEQRKRRPLELKDIEFLNTTKDGTVLSGPSKTFNISKVLFVGWRAIFKNRLYGLDANQYRVDAAYLGPDSSMLGSVSDVRMVKPTNGQAVFSGRVGNSAGGAFPPGKYTVKFYLNGQYFTQRTFRVVANAGVPYSGGGGGGGASVPTSSGIEVPTVATGTIAGLGGLGGSAPMELRLRPQPNGFLHGVIVVHLSKFGQAPIEGFVRGNHVLFQVAYNGEIFDFDGQRRRDVLSGTFQTTSGSHGTWTTHTD